MLNYEQLVNGFSSFERFTQDFLKLQNCRSEVFSFNLNEYQRDVLTNLNSKTLVNGITANRQEGLTTLLVSFALYQALTTRSNILLTPHNSKMTRHIVSMLDSFLSNIPSLYNPEIVRHSADDLQFKHGSSIRISSDLEPLRGTQFDMILVDRPLKNDDIDILIPSRAKKILYIKEIKERSHKYAPV